MGIFKKIRNDDGLVAHGVPARATIESLELLNRGEFQVSGKKVDQMARGEGTTTTARFVLRVEGNGEPYSVKHKQPVPMMEWTKLGPGGVVTVLVDPDDRKHLQIDFDAEIVEPTLEQRAEHDPMLRELLDRRVDPPAPT